MTKLNGEYYDADLPLEVYINYEDEPPTVEVTLPSMVSLTPEAARRFGLAIVNAADIAESEVREGR